MSGGLGWDPIPGSAGALDDLSDVDTSSTAPSDGDSLVYDSASGLWVPQAVAGGSAAATEARSVRTAGNLTPAGSTTWSAITTAHDVTIAASTGDKLLVGVSFYALLVATFTGIEMFTMNGSTRVNGITAGGASEFGTPAWSLPNSSFLGTELPVGGVTPYTVVAGDVFSGNVTLRLHYRQGGATSFTVRANSAQPFTVFAVNLG